MQIKLKKQTTNYDKRKEIGSSLAISFFFAAFFLVFLLMTCKNSFDKYLNLLNLMSVEVKESNNLLVSVDEATNKIAYHPNYGLIYATLKIPSINLKYPVYRGDTLDILMKGIGNYAGSFFPGDGGSIIFAAHNNVHFQHLYDIKEGDLVIVETIYGTFTYQAYDFKIIDATDEASLPIQDQEEILMMYTCYPRTAVGHADKRYVVYSKLIGVDYEKVKSD